MNKVRVIFITCFILFISGIGIQTIVNKTEKSTTEGRTLKQFPDLDYGKLSDAAWYTDIGDAFSDQIFCREQMIHAYYNMLMNGAGITYANAIVRGAEDNLYNEPEIISDEAAYAQRVIDCAELINQEAAKISKTGAKFIYINYPRKDVVQWKQLPSYYPDSKADYDKYTAIMKAHLSENVIFIDANELFKQDTSVDYYYKTDHHVNIRGQQLIYDAFMDIVEQNYPNVVRKTLDDYEIIKQKVIGAFNRKVGNAIDAGEEELNIKPKGWELHYTRNSKAPINGMGNTYASAYMGGDYAFTEIQTEQEQAPSVMICGSSFTNTLETLVVPSCRQLISIDYRYNKTNITLAEYAQQYEPDYVIYIPNQSNEHFSYENWKLHLGLKN